MMSENRYEYMKLDGQLIHVIRSHRHCKDRDHAK